ncbi:MAG: hypothetical protein CL567_03290 [Alphaproteobacteria bacterium]|nr:hypothetical protein [Alphaproteobacteria bacterium]|tara:strand:- start:2884 stop:4113 length:1230 start_codon:yes stop_codon:yes gene_type:complete
MTDRVPPTINVAPQSKRSRFPLAVLSIFLILLGVGLYLAWPAIEGGLNRPEFSPQLGETGLTESMNVHSQQQSNSDTQETTNTNVVENNKSNLKFDSVLSPSEHISQLLESIDELKNNIKTLEENILAQKTQQIKNTQTLETVIKEIQSFNARISNIESNFMDTQKSSKLLSDNNLNRRLTEIERALLELDSSVKLEEFGKIADDALSEVNSLDFRVENLETKVIENKSNAQDIVLQSLALGRLLASASVKRDITPELAALRLSSKNDIEINSILEEIEILKVDKILTKEVLKYNFSKVSDDILRKANSSNDDWLSETITELKNIVVVRRIRGDFSPKSIDFVLLQTEQALSSGDLESAVQIIKPHKILGVISLNQWLDDAEQRLNLDSMLAKLNQILLARVNKTIDTD